MSQGPHTNSSTRSMLNTENPNAIRIVYRAPISEKWKMCLCCYGIVHPFSCLICKREEVWQSTYVQVHENRIEWNYPLPRCHPSGCCKYDDLVGVLYFDTPRMGGVGKAGFCMPLCTHNHCFPTCCDMCGEAIVTHTEPLCCRRWVCLPGLENADALVDQIKQAKAARMTTGMAKS